MRYNLLAFFNELRAPYDVSWISDTIIGRAKSLDGS